MKKTKKIWISEGLNMIDKIVTRNNMLIQNNSRHRNKLGRDLGRNRVWQRMVFPPVTHCSIRIGT